MSKFKLTHTIDSSGLNKKIKEIIKNTDTTEVMDQIGADMRTQTQLNFRKKRSPDGIEWKKHANSTKKSYASKGRTSPQLLQNTTNLRKSVNIYTSTRTTASMKSNLVYSATHQYGDNRSITKRTKYGRSRPYNRNIPARPYMGITRSMVIRYNRMVKFYILTGKT